jgi:hypothetical protein
MFKDIKTLLPRSVKRAGISRKLQTAGILHIFRQEAEKILQGDLTDQVKPLYMKRGVLVVATLSSLAAKKLQENEKKLLRRLNRAGGEEAVEKIEYLA